MPVSSSGLLLPGGAPTPEQLAGPPDPSLPIEVTTAFIVYQLSHGGWHLTPLDRGELKPQRDVTFDDMTAGCANLLRDLDVRFPADDEAVVTAFIIFQLPTGLWQIAPKVAAPLMPARQPGMGDFIGGLSVTVRDVHTNEIAQATAQATVQAQFQLGQAVAEQRQEAMVKAQLEADKDKARRGGRG